MLNRMTNLLDELSGAPVDRERSWDVDQQPAIRLFWLFVVLTIPVGTVMGRLAYLQLFLADRYLTGFEQTTETFEPIPSRDGRILAADGRVLAYDLERFNVLVHYRWLETPSDDKWLRQQALSRLKPKERRDSAQRQQQIDAVEQSKAALWERLARISRTSPEALDRRRSAIQRRVERIAASVRRRHEERNSNSSRRRSKATSKNDTESRGEPSPSQGESWWTIAWERVVDELTTPPKRTSDEPIVIREELDYHPILENVPLELAAEIESHPERYPGLKIEVSTRRHYPEGPLAAHLIGNRTRLDTGDYQSRQADFPHGDPLDYQVGDRIGRTGVERAYDRQLRGLRGLKRIVKNRQGEIIHSEIVRPPRIGRDIVLTVDMALQSAAEQLLDRALHEPVRSEGDGDADSSPVPQSGPQGGSLVALDIHTGEVLVAADAPRFDLNLLVDPDPDEWKQVLTDSRRPMFPRSTRMTIPPGSVFKALTAIAVLESGRIDPDVPVICHGYLDRPNRHRCYIYRHFGVGHGEMNLSDALCQSCNVYFYSTGRTTGPESMVEWAHRFGFGQPSGIDLPGERGGTVPHPNRKSRNGRSEPWYPGDTLGLAIGQSRLTVTPLQIVRLMAAIANDGSLVTPHVVRNTGPIPLADDSTTETFSPSTGRSLEPRPISGLHSGTLQRVREGLEKVVAHPRGTAYKTVRLKQIGIAGKTGTAEVGGGLSDHAWFAGYVPADRPRIAFVVVLEHGGSGGRNAGPVAKQFVEALLDHGFLQPREVTLNR